MPPLPPSDFCLVQLTAEGAAFSKGDRLHIADGRFHFAFEPNKCERVAKYEWEMFLSRQHTPLGEPLFELVIPAEQVTAGVAAAPQEKK